MIHNLSPTDEATLRAYVRTQLAATRYSDLNLHLVSAHCNGAGLTNTHAEAIDSHHHEHHGPGGIRNHPFDNLFFDVDKIATILIDCAEMDTDRDDVTAYKTAIDALMERPDEITRIAPGAHLHDPVTDPIEFAGYTGEQCTIAQCDRYPRLYDIVVTKTPDGDFKDATWTQVLTHDEDLAATTRLARTALSKATAALKALEHNHQSARILPEVTNTQARLTNLPLTPTS